MRLRFAFFCLCLCFAFPAWAEDYDAITWPNLLHTLERFNALDLEHDNALLDDYALVTDCDLYHYYYKDDFKWNQIRALIHQSNEKNSATYPTRYYFDTKFQLDRYDFNDKLYRFMSKNQIRSLGSIVIFNFTGPACDNVTVHYLPSSYRAKFTVPLTIPGLALDPKTTEVLLHYMDATGNNDHYIFARFNMTILYMEPLRRATQADNSYRYFQTRNDHSEFLMDARVDSVEFYKDPEMTQLVYTFKPS